MLIKEFRPKEPLAYLQLVNAIRLGWIAQFKMGTETAIYTGRLVASHPERMSFSLLVEDVTTLN